MNTVFITEVYEMEETKQNLKYIEDALAYNAQRGIQLEKDCENAQKIKHFIGYLFELGEGN